MSILTILQSLEKASSFNTDMENRFDSRIDYPNNHELETAVQSIKSQIIDIPFLLKYLRSLFDIPKEITMLIASFTPFRLHKDGLLDLNGEWVDYFERTAKDYNKLDQSAKLLIDAQHKGALTKFFIECGLLDSSNIPAYSNNHSMPFMTDDIGIKKAFPVIKPCDVSYFHYYYFKEIYYIRYTEISTMFGPIGRGPTEILGQLSDRFNNLWFFWKNGHPNWLGHGQDKFFIGIVSTTLHGLLLKMDKRDINLFINNIEKYEPMSLDRCGCCMCIQEWNKLNKINKELDSIELDSTECADSPRSSSYELSSISCSDFEISEIENY